ncbi:MAG: NAD(P)-dependent oxidoreductase [Burkholderiaceae bacterium]|nr:NAD(P)-dependent oxidoreductase [Burkholderiaceae bacterium]
MSKPIGFIGIGQMGRPMVERLAGAGHAVLVHDRRTEALAPLSAVPGVTAAASAALLAQSCEAIILMLPDSPIVDALLWSDGFAASLPRGSLLIDMGSSNPNATRANQAKLAAMGIALVDAPVSGGVRRAVDGSLAIMVGGASGDVERALPLLQPMGKSIVPVGPPGAGHAVKALNNYVSAAGLVAACEALVAAEKFGIDPSVANRVFNVSTGRNNTTDVKVEQFMLSGTFSSGFAAALMRKDLDTAHALMQSLDSERALMEACARMWQQAEAALPKGADHTAMFTYVKQG